VEDQPFVVFYYLGGWRIRRGKWQSRRYRTQEDTFRVVRGLSQSLPGRPPILLETDDGALKPLEDTGANSKPTGVKDVPPLASYLERLRGRISEMQTRVEKQKAHLSLLDDTHPEVAAGRSLLSAMESRLQLLVNHLAVLEPAVKRLERQQYQCDTKLRPFRAKEPGFIAFKKGEERAVIQRTGAHWILHQSAPPALHDISEYAGLDLPVIAAVVDLYLDGVFPGPLADGPTTGAV